MAAHDSRVETSRDVTELLKRGCDLAPRLIESAARFGVALQIFFPQAELEREGDQPLLGAVVQIALEPFPLCLAGFDDSGARSPELIEASPQLGVQPTVLE